MKVIKIYHENCEPQEILDDDNTNLEEYVKKLSAVLEASKVTILQTSSCCLITRPSRIISITVSDDTEIDPSIEPQFEADKEETEEITTEVTESHEPKPPEEKLQEEEQQEDVITDED